METKEIDKAQKSNTDGNDIVQCKTETVADETKRVKVIEFENS